MGQRRSQREYNARYYRDHREAEVTRVRERQRRTLEHLRALRRVPCGDCGISFEPVQMDFDHREPQHKAFRVTSGGAMLASASRLESELAKCDIVCANCHRVRTRAAPRTLRAPGRSPGLAGRRARWREQAALLDQLRDVPCTDCAGRFAPCAMDFDHRDPAVKEEAVTRMIGRAGTMRILAEVRKCDIVCANCHRLRTHQRRTSASERE